MRLRIEKSGHEKRFAFSYLVSKSTFNLFFYLYYFDIEIRYYPKDWMVYKETMRLEDGRRFKSYEKNEKYKNLKFYTFLFPAE